MYGFNYLEDDIDFETLLRYFPLLAQCRFGLFGKVSTIPEGWHYLYLGTGRHLIIEESVYPEFEEQTLDYGHPYELAAEWWILARQILEWE